MTDTALCRSCGAPITWTVTDATGKRMPVDAVATERGTIGLYFPDNGRGPVVSVVVGENGPAPRYTSHFATCPDAAKHRRAR